MTAAPTSLPTPGNPCDESLSESFLRAKILIVDDKEANVTLLQGVLGGAGYESVTSTLDPRAVCALHAKNCYDLILLDLRMPGMDGFEVMEGLKKIETGGYLPVLVITAEPDHKLRALRAGAKDFISKPFDIAEVLTRVRNMLEVRLLHGELRRKNEELTKLFDELVTERKVSERLALHVPADSIAARLQARPDVTPEHFTDVTVLIADVVGFAALTPAEPPERPEQLASLLDEAFSAFDALVAERGMRKIKTLGNSYMAAGGMPLPQADHASRAVNLALDMEAAIERLNQRRGTSLQARIGVASGDVMAGVIGKRMYVYDIWGEAVNAASRMESHSVAGRVLASEATRERVAAEFVLEARGAIETTGEAAVKAWFVAGRSHAAG